MEPRFKKYDLLVSSYLGEVVLMMKLIPHDYKDRYGLKAIINSRIYPGLITTYVDNNFVLLTDIFRN